MKAFFKKFIAEYKKRGKMILSWKKLSKRKKTSLVLIVVIIFLFIVGGYFLAKKFAPKAEEVVGAPQTIKVLKAPSTVSSIFKTENPARLYALDTHGFKIFDVTSPLQPRELSDYEQQNTKDLYVVGNNLFTLVGQRLFIFDISNPASIIKLSEINIPDQTWYRPQALDYLNNRVYVVTSDAKVKVVDVSNPALPSIERSINIAGILPLSINTDDIKVRNFAGSVYIFVADGNNGLKIADSSGLIGSIQFSGRLGGYNAYDIEISGNYAYVAVGSGGVHIVDLIGIGTPTFNPSVVDKMLDGLSWEKITALSVSGNYLYACNADIVTRLGAYVFDISNPADGSWLPGPEPTVGGIPSPNFPTQGNLHDLVIDSSGYLYVADEMNLFDVFTIGASPASPYPAQISQIAPVIADPWDLAFVGNNGLAVISLMGIHFMDIANPTDPLFESRYYHRNSTPIGQTRWGYGAIASNGNYLFYSKTAADGQFVVMDASNLSSPTKVASITLDTAATGANSYTWWPYDMIVAGNYVFVVGGAQGNPYGLYVVDITDPTNPTKKVQIDLGGTPWRLAYRNGWVYIANRNLNTVQVIDFRDPENPHFPQVNFPDQTGPNHSFAYPDVAIKGNNLLVSDYGNGVYFYDLANPLAPSFLSFLSNISSYDIEVAGNLLYSVDNQVCVSDIENSNNPRILVCGGQHPDVGVETRMRVRGQLGFTTGYFPTPNDHVRIVSLPPLAEYNLTINKTVSDADEFDVWETTSNMGETLTYKLNYVNTGNTTLTNGIITDTLPNLTAYSSGGSYDPQTGVISFNVGNLVPGASGQVVFRALINTGLSVGTHTIINFGTIDVAEFLPIDSNQVRSIVAVGPQIGNPALEITKTVSDSDQIDVLDSNSSPGERLIYKLNYVNSGDVPLTDAMITDQLPDKTNYMQGGNFNSGSKVVSFNVGDLTQGDSGQVSFEVMIDQNLPVGTHEIINYGTIDTAELDPVDSNRVRSVVTVTAGSIIIRAIQSGSGVFIILLISVLIVTGIIILKRRLARSS